MSIVFKRTKILATLGPATNSSDMIDQMVAGGVNAFRMNFSHGDYEERIKQIEWIREASKKHNRIVAILQDIQGPKIRLGKLNVDRQDVYKNDELILDSSAEHDGMTIPIQYNLAEKVKVGEPIYIFDGKIRTTVIDIPSSTAVKVRVENDGFIMSRKGINLPDTDFGGDILTPKDIQDIEFGAQRDFDYVAISFVQSPDDITTLRQMLLSHNSSAQIIAKVETKAAIEASTLKEIVKVSDGVMVARGDLAVEAGAEVVPIVQRQIIALCRKHGRISIVATQMLASMVDAPEPTRAEVGDVAGAVIQGADAVMLSDETANGKYPLETIAAMKKTILYTQEHAPVEQIKDVIHGKDSQQDAIAAAAVKLAEQLRVDAIVAETKSGSTAEAIAANRPNLPIISVSSEPRAAQQLALSYANQSFLRPDGDKAGLGLVKELKSSGYFGDQKVVKVAIVSGRQPGLTGATDTIRVRGIE